MTPGRGGGWRALLFVALLGAWGGGALAIKEPKVPTSVESYSFMWWAHGWRERSPEGKRILNLQSDRWGMAIDVERAGILHLGRILDPADYASAAGEGNDRVFSLPWADLALLVTSSSGEYRCVRVNPKALPRFEPPPGRHPDTGYVTDGHPSRLIASGRFVQRVDLMYLEFEDAQGKLLPALGRLEVIAWPDRIGFLLEVTPDESLEGVRIEIELNHGGAASHRSASFENLQPGSTARVHLTWSPDPPTESETGSLQVSAVDLNEGTAALDTIEEATGGWIRIPMQSRGRGLPRNRDHLDRYALALTNPTETARTARLFFQFEGEGCPPITGFTPILLDEAGEPSGIPVQISKNWHRQEGKTFLYEGPWFHGFTLIPLAPGETWKGSLAIVSGHWGGVPAASHGQLSLIGWGVNQLWDQVAIGSWGESICYDPDVNLNRSTIDDIRPLMVWGMTDDDHLKKWSWTHNVGGGDFLVYFDAEGQKRFLTRMKTAYLRYGPNLTEAVYSGVTADGKIAASFSVSSPRCDDLNRAYHRVRYDVLEPTPFSRLAFYQVGADGYNDHSFDKLARGNREGLIEEWTFTKGGRRYDRRGIPCEGSAPWWFSLHEGSPPDRPNQRTGGAWANRGLIVRSWKARLGGRIVPIPSVSFFGTENGGIPGMNVELSPPEGLERLQVGDFIEAELELIIPPISASDYYGPNENLRKALEEGGNTWKPVHREAAGNPLEIQVGKGTLLAIHPIRLRVDGDGGAEFEVTGGVGYVPVTLEGLRGPTGYELLEIAGDRTVRVDQSVHGNDFWQTDFDSESRSWSRTYNLPLDAPEDRLETRRFRFEEN